MANRTVATAARSMGGCGYIVVGAEPRAPTLASRKRERLEKISEALDATFDRVKEANTADRPQIVWTTQRNRLEDALDACDGPEMVSVTSFIRAGTAYQALMYYSAARGEAAWLAELWPNDEYTVIVTDAWRQHRPPGLSGGTDD
jgi:hypothetical protein